MEGFLQWKDERPGEFLELRRRQGYDLRESYNWLRIDQAFSRPVVNSDDTAEYAPTQILAETFRRHGFDGVIYKSSAAEGRNVALFSPGYAKVVDCSIVVVRRVRIDFQELGLNEYRCWPHGEQVEAIYGKLPD
jgi:hypothetical protein